MALSKLHVDGLPNYLSHWCLWFTSKPRRTYYFLFAQASNNYFTIILVYIYDIIITMNDLKGIKVVKENLYSIFKLTKRLEN